MAHICKHNKQFLKHNKHFSKHNIVLSEHNKLLSKHNTVLSKHITILSKHNTIYRNTTQCHRNTTRYLQNTTQFYQTQHEYRKHNTIFAKRIPPDSRRISGLDLLLYKAIQSMKLSAIITQPLTSYAPASFPPFCLLSSHVAICPENECVF